MNINLNKKTINRFLEVSISTGLILTTLSGCSDKTPIIIEPESISSTINYEETFVTFKNIDLYKWAVIKYTDGETKMTKYTTFDKYTLDVKNYYYVDVFGKGQVLGQVTYDRAEDAYWIAAGKDIESAVLLSDYIDEHEELYKNNYTKEDIENLYKIISNEYEKEISNKDKILIKENSLY
ncbi:MAG: hypothetical protein ACI4OT_00130 [Bacilli bacterium]